MDRLNDIDPLETREWSDSLEAVLAQEGPERAHFLLELLVDKATLAKTYVLRRILAPMGTVDAIEFLLDKLKNTKTNSDFFDSMNT